jgi:hypothetical protein
MLDKTLFAIVENDSFLAQTAMISTLNSFLAFLKSNQILKDFIESAKSDPVEYVGHMTERIERLLQCRVKTDRLNPNDRVIATYLFIISEISNKDIKKSRLEVQRAHLDNLWWTNFLCEYIKGLEKSVETKKIYNSSYTHEIIPFTYTHTPRMESFDAKNMDFNLAYI